MKECLVKNQKTETENVEIKGYAKYILNKGTIYEKRELMSKMKSRLILQSGEIVIKD